MSPINIAKTDVNSNRQSTGCIALDTFLGGGYEKDIITTLYGPSGSGKTTLALLAAVETIKNNKKKVIYIDTESSFSVERLKQVSDDYENIMKNILFLKPINFNEQQKAFDKLRVLVDHTIGLIVIDTISMLYRLEIGQTKDIYEVNKKLGVQLAYLSGITRKNNIPVLVTNQVYSSFEEKDKVNIVGGDILRYSSKTLIELQCKHTGVRRMIVRKSRSLPEDKKFCFRLIAKGIEEFNEDDTQPAAPFV
jgi:DNA repair protein RadB